MADLLFEIFSEEVPARMQQRACEEFQHAIWSELQKAGINITFRDNSPNEPRKLDGDLYGYVSPRHLAVIVKNLPLAQPDVSVEKKGPKVDAPEAAIQGFLKSSGLTLEQCEKRKIGKDEVLFAVVHQKGQPTATLLKTMLEKIIADFTWPKSMRWGTYEQPWVRPMHAMICLLDDKVIPVQFGPITASNVTYGHRFLAPQAITIKHPKDYETALEKAFVLVDREKRKEKIKTLANEAAKAKGLKVKDDIGLLEEVTGLVEWPNILVGTIDASYMDLPPEVLVSEMKNHQKYFALLDAKGNMAPHFLITSNMATSDQGKAIIAGNERVLRARLADGRFFWDQDRKKSLTDWAKGLKDVTFHAKLGTIAEKVERITALAEKIAEFVPSADKTLVKRAAQLCKADLVTGMVGEFPELQGVMGRYYAKAQKEPEAVVEAIKEHYSPQGPADSCPSAPVSVCIALADKLDTLVGMFAIGEKPTGSKDPFALRRSALGIIRIILENKIRLELDYILTLALALHRPKEVAGKNFDERKLHFAKEILELLDFFADRLKVSLKDQGIRHDFIAAVFDGNDTDLVRVVSRVKALESFLKNENGTNLLAAYKRAANIVAIEQKKDSVQYIEPPKEDLLEQAEEKQLYNELRKAIGAASSAKRNEDFESAMTELSQLRKSVDAFFDKVMVNSDKKEIRANRLRTLTYLRSTMDSIANFSLIEG